VDPAALERDRMASMQAGWTPAEVKAPGASVGSGASKNSVQSGGKNVLRSLVYVTFQELATRIAHRNTGRLAGDPAADRLLARIAADENMHMIFYRDLIAASLRLAPDQAMDAIAAEAVGFQMPGTSVPGFLRKSIQIADAGIYDVRIHRDEVMVPLVRHWQALELPMTTQAGQRAQDVLARHVDELEQMARRYEERRELRRVTARSTKST
jgi:acyl-[acyl-carrier-protein] desaturase